MTVKVIHFLSAQQQQNDGAGVVVKRVNPLNPLGRRLRQLIWETLDEVENDDTIHSIILYGGTHFSAGADLTEFSSTKNDGSTSSAGKYMLPDLIQKIEDYPKPIIAAMSGVALGGGLEVALSCHYRVCTSHNATQFGLPEVHVGVIPGAGGTQRLPRLIGATNALEMILQGKPINAKKALQLGLVDSTSTTSLLDCATKWAKWAECMPLYDRRVGQLPMKESKKEFDMIIKHTRKMLPSVEKGGEGVHAALNAIQDGCLLPIQQGMEIEANQFMLTLIGEQGNARRHTFFAVRNAQKPMMIAAEQQQQQLSLLLSNIKKHPLMIANKKQQQPTLTAVIGAGLMGSGIALVLLQAGYIVYLVDVAQPSLEKGASFIIGTIKSYVKRGKISSQVGEHLIKSLRPTMDMKQLHSCSLVVEAVIENLNIKRKIFTSLEQITKPGTILCSNTSTLDIDKMAHCVSKSRRCDFAGLHFFSPAHVMKLVEIIHGTETSSSTIALLQQLCKKLKKTAVVVGNCDGFVGNRMLISYGAESAIMLEEGTATVQSMDNALVDFGMVMGPLAMGDLAGLDIGYNIRKERGWVQLSPNDPIPKHRPDRYPEAADMLASSKFNRLGQKTGKGWYDYDSKIGKGRKPIPSKFVSDLINTIVIKKHGKHHNIPKYTNEKIIHRVLFPMVNEGFKCLEENIARCPSDIDVIYLYGYGFPSHKGGPMYWGDHIVGLETILSVLNQLYQQFPTTEYYKPSELLKTCVSLNMTVSKYYKLGYHNKKKQTKNMSKL